MNSMLDENDVINRIVKETYCKDCRKTFSRTYSHKNPPVCFECLKKKDDLIIEAILVLASAKVRFLTENDIFAARFSYPKYLKYVQRKFKVEDL